MAWEENQHDINSYNPGEMIFKTAPPDMIKRIEYAKEYKKLTYTTLL